MTKLLHILKTIVLLYLCPDEILVEGLLELQTRDNARIEIAKIVAHHSKGL